MRYYHTIRYLKPIQIVGRFWFYLKKPVINVPVASLSFHLPEHWAAPTEKYISLTAPKTLHLLNREYQLTQASDWQNPQLEKLFLYHLHYFDDLNAKRDSQRLGWQQDMIATWIQDNAPGQGIGWEPYPLSLRIVNWIKWIYQGNSPTDNMTKGLFCQADYLCQRLEWHLLGNHLLANAKALLFAGLFFQQKTWIATSLKILKAQFAEQILADGGHFERSTLYHCIVLEDLLDCINVLSAYRHNLPICWQNDAVSMLKWLQSMLHPDGDITLFNDAAFKAAANPAEFFSYAQRLRLNFQPEINSSNVDSLFFQNSGYARLRLGKAHVFVDVAPVGPDYLPGHAHADTFTFECSLDRQRVIVNSGVSTYESGPERLRQRSTAAHNSLVIDGLNSSNIWSSFRVAQRAKVFNISFQQASVKKIVASHNGYRRLPGNAVHQRTWTLTEHHLMIEDEISGTGRHHLHLPFHFYPGLNLDKIDNQAFQIKKADQSIAKIALDPSLTAKVASSSFHPEFGLSVANQKLVGEVMAELPVKLITQISWN